MKTHFTVEDLDRIETILSASDDDVALIELYFLRLDPAYKLDTATLVTFIEALHLYNIHAADFARLTA